MSLAVDEILIEAERGCGRRRGGPNGYGLYLVGRGFWTRCGRLPFPLRTCSTCGHTPTHSRGFSWISPKLLFADNVEPVCDEAHRGESVQCALCPMGGGKPDRAGLMWVGRSFYTPQSFAYEAVTQGISKRISDVPTDFVIGRDIIYLAHLDACEAYDEDEDALVPWPGVFMTFRPERVELVVDDPYNVPEAAVELRDRLRDRQVEFDADEGCIKIVAVVADEDLAEDEDDGDGVPVHFDEYAEGEFADIEE